MAPCPRAAAVPLADTAIFLNRGSAATPLATRANVGHHQVLREHVAFILAIETAPVPYVPPARRFRADDLGYKDDRISHVTATFGYMDSPDVPGLLPLLRQAGRESPLDESRISYFLSTIDLRPGTNPGMSRWRKRLFLARLTADAAEYFRLPGTRPSSWDPASSSQGVAVLSTKRLLQGRHQDGI